MGKKNLIKLMCVVEYLVVAGILTVALRLFIDRPSQIDTFWWVVILLLPLPSAFVMYQRAVRYYRCPSCQAEFGLSQVQSVAYPMFRCSECGARHYRDMPRAGGDGGV